MTRSRRQGAATSNIGGARLTCQGQVYCVHFSQLVCIIYHDSVSLFKHSYFFKNFNVN